jgi:hypothetical protein
MQNLIHYYKDQTGKTEVDMKDVAKFAVSKGWKLPVPESPIDRFAKALSQAAREELKYDQKTGKPYRVNHVISVKQGEEQFHLWIDIDEAPRNYMVKSLIMRREQMVNDGLQLTFDADHWNNINPTQAPIQIPMDFTEDIAERKNAPDEKKKAA